MSTREPETDPFIDALRADLPTERDEARVRARLLAAGVIASTGLAAPGVAAGGAAAGGLLPKLLALPMFAKVGLAATVVGLSAVPVARYGARNDVTVPATQSTVPEARPTAVAAAPTQVEPANVAPPSIEPAATAKELPRERARSLPEFSGVSVAPATPSEAVPVVERPSIGAFEPPPAQLDEGTLRAETALIEGALAAIRGGDTTRARDLLTRHATQFPHGLLVRERERALALSRTSDTTRGAADGR
jgi:hypothetical protein